MNRPKLLFFVTEDWVFCSHRLPLGQAAVRAGYDVVIVTRVRKHQKIIEDAGIRVVPLEHNRGGLNLFAELKTLFRLWLIYREERPDLVHQVALKPIVSGGIVAGLLGIVQVNAVTGLGWVYTSQSKKARGIGIILSFVLQGILRRGICILQNLDDLNWARQLSLPAHSLRLIRGAGVDIQKFHPKNKVLSETPVVMLVARMLRDKGVVEFVDAAKQLHSKGIIGRFVLVGEPDPANRASLSKKQLEEWQGQGWVEWWGHHEDISACYAQAQIACLPSYREGLPKSLLEAMACGLPIVTTDVPGCRELIIPQENGLLVPAQDFRALAGALEFLLSDQALMDQMGKRSREFAEQEFSVEHIIQQTLSVYQESLR